LELREALEILAEYRDSIVYLIAKNIGSYDSENVEKAINEVVSYLEEGGEEIE